MLAALEHHVFEQVGKARLARDFVFRADLVPDLDVNDGHAVLDMQENVEAIRQSILLERDVGHGGLSSRWQKRECYGKDGSGEAAHMHGQQSIAQEATAHG